MQKIIKTILKRILALVIFAAVLTASLMSITYLFRLTEKIPDVLTFFDGNAVGTEADWERRSGEIKEYFWENVFGVPPAAPEGQVFVSDGVKYFTEKGITRETILYKAGEAFSARFYIYKDSRDLDSPKPFLIHNMHRSQEVNWDIHNSLPPDNLPDDVSSLPVRKILDAGFNLAVCINGDFAGEGGDVWETGIFKSLVAERERNTIKTIGAWSFGISRLADYLLAYENVKDGKIGVGGHSRGGKAALLAGMNDERIGFVWSSCSGCTGAAIARKRPIMGESTWAINFFFPGWFCDNYKNFNRRESAMELDFHCLAASIAPRLLYISSASKDFHATPKNELLSAMLASAVYENIYGIPGAVVAPSNPKLNENYHNGNIGYHIKKGGHCQNTEDWARVLEFLNGKGWGGIKYYL